MRNLYILLFLLVAKQLWSQDQRITISGYITDEQSGENLIGANVIIPGTTRGTVSNTYGFYSITLSPVEQIHLQYSFVSYQTQTITFRALKDTTIHIKLTPQTRLDEVVVSGSRPIQELTKMSAISLSVQDVKTMPALMGETDIFKTLQLMPGIQSGVEGSSGLFVRGGSPGENLILIDGVPVYNASHLFGFFSVFNTDALHNVEVLKGGFPARYGGRLSSVIDISMKEGNMKEWRAEGGIGLIASRLTVEGPLVKDKASIMLSGRRTYVDVLARPFIAMANRQNNQSGERLNFGYYFYDFNGKINYKLSEKDRIYLSAYTGDDRFYFRLRDTDNELDFRSRLNWGNFNTALRWNHLFSNRLFANMTLTYSRFSFGLGSDIKAKVDIGDDNEPLELKYDARFISGIKDVSLKYDIDYYPAENHEIKAGIQSIRHAFQPEAVVVNTSIGDQDSTYGSVNPIIGWENAIYIEDDYTISKQWKVNAGLRYSAFITDGEFYHALQPRVAARFLINEKLSLKASYADMMQFIHLLTNSGIGLPTDLWVPSTAAVPPARSKQVAVGMSTSVWSDKYELSIEGFYKYLDGVIEYKEGTDFLSGSDNWDQKVARGQGWAYGGEFLLRKNSGRFNGWLAYTLAWNNRQFDDLNFGEIFPFRYDRRHDISLVGNYALSKKWQLSATWVYGTGHALTVPVAAYPSADFNLGNVGYSGGLVYQYSARNAYRMPSYHRMDVGISRSKEKKWGESRWTLSIYNMYNRQNPFFIMIGTNNEGNRAFMQYSIFQIIPTISYNFKIYKRNDTL